MMAARGVRKLTRIAASQLEFLIEAFSKELTFKVALDFLLKRQVAIRINRRTSGCTVDRIRFGRIPGFLSVTGFSVEQTHN